MSITKALDLPALAESLERALGSAPPAPAPVEAAPPTTANGSPVSIRSLLRSKMPPEKVVKLIEESINEALNAEKPEWIECRKCGTKTAVVFPNLDVRVKAAAALLGELEGKVGTLRPEAPAGPKGKVGDLTELSDEDLLALLHNPQESTNAD